MTSRLHTRPVLVGYDGSVAGRAAVLVAAGEAASAHRPLQIVHVVEPGELHLTMSGRRRVERFEAEGLLVDAIDIGRLVLPERAIHAELALGGPAAVLLRLSRGADIVVVGRGGAGILGDPLGSVALALATGAACPAVIVPSLSAAGPMRGGVVVVGVDGVEESREALVAAFTAAEAHRAAVSAVHVYRDAAAPGNDDARVLSEALQPFRDKFSHVQVTEHLVQGSPTPALIEASAQARLLVVGARGRGSRDGLSLGSVSRSLIRSAGCPVLVAREREG